MKEKKKKKIYYEVDVGYYLDLDASVRLMREEFKHNDWQRKRRAAAGSPALIAAAMDRMS